MVRWWIPIAATAFAGLAACGAHERSPAFAGEGEPAAEIEYDDPAAKNLPPPDWQNPDIFPCTGCHDATLPPNPTRRALGDPHDVIVLKHDEKHRWCLDCHDAENRDRLRLASGVLVPFGESYRLCGQCHGDKYRDWRAGVHGRRSGMWNGEKEYRLCVHCHDSHSPRFKPVKPEPPPIPPSSLR